MMESEVRKFVKASSLSSIRLQCFGTSNMSDRSAVLVDYTAISHFRYDIIYLQYKISGRESGESNLDLVKGMCIASIGKPETPETLENILMLHDHMT